jgi:GT2 family glycosyltransferase
MAALGRPKIVLLGMLTKMPVAGVAWLVAQYSVGFERLGYDVYYVEAHARTPSMFVSDEDGDDGSERAAAYLDRVMRRFGLGDRWALHALHADGRYLGMGQAEVARLYRDAALIVNMHGGTVPLPEHAASGRLVLLGTDPVELELELARGDARAIEFVDAHAAHFTWGLNYGNPDCALPWAGRYGFVPTPPPVVLDFWAGGEAALDAPFTTVGNWRQDWRELRLKGELYSWSKHHEFLKILDLPARVPARFELALSSCADADRALLTNHGWAVRPGLSVSADLEDYRGYLTSSAGEFTVAKDQNVRFRSGWFSERSASYLAAGRPVIMQDTGFGNALPAGTGLLPFSDLNTAAAAVESVLAEEKRHRRAAGDIAREYLSHDVVLGALLDHVGLPAPRPARAALLPPPAPADLPPQLDLRPLSRRPLVLAAQTVQQVLARPVPTVPAGRPDATVAVVVLDNLAVTRMAVESVLACTPNVELIVVDNGSGAETGKYVQVLAARNRSVRLIANDTNRGFAGGANQALGLARGEVVVLLNNDTIVTPGWLDGLRGILGDRGVGLVGPATNRCGNEAEVPASYRTHEELVAFAAARGSAAFDLPVAVMFCAALRRDVLEEVGLLDERFEVGLFEDDDYSRRVRAAGYRVVCEPGVFVHHFGEATLGGLVADGRYGELFAANRERFERKWGVPWTGHRHRPYPGYAALTDRLRQRVVEVAAPGALVLVVSKGDEALVDLPGRRAWHFPCDAAGGYAGHHPGDDADAIARLEALRHGGADYLVIPEPSSWWLEHYAGFARHLADRYALLLDEPGTGTVYALEGAHS